MAELNGTGRVIGSLGGMGQIGGGLTGAGHVTGALTIPATVNVQRYDGEYLVVPNYQDQILATNGKLMTDDVEVMAIPVSIVENLSGGNTVIIGG